MRCRICSQATKDAFILRSRRHDVDVPVFRCDACDAYFSNGGPVNYEDANLVDYYTHYATIIRARYERIFERVESLVGPASFFDIGAGMGFSLEVAQRRGWSSRGLEPNQLLAKHAADRGLAIANGYLDRTAHGQYDFVLVDNVLEHISEPVEFLQNAAHLLCDSGIMVVAIPPMDWLRKGLAAIPYVRDRVAKPQLNIFNEVDEHLNMLSRNAAARLIHAAALHLQPVRFHHSPVYDNALFRAVGLDDGYYFISKTAA